MKAVLYRNAGAVRGFAIEEVEKPVPADDEVLVAVHAAAVNILDRYLLPGRVSAALGRRAPTRLGRDIAGVVESVGRSVTRAKPGDEVFGLARGGFAEYVATREASVAVKPPNVSFAQAAGAGVAGLTALQAVRKAGRLESGEKVLINGASGGIGTFAVQIAKALGAEVTAVCSARNVEMVRTLGADHIIDYETSDFASGPKRYDLILDIVAAHSWLRRAAMLTPTGRYVFVGGPPLRGVRMFFVSLFAGRRLISFITKPSPADLDTLAGLMRSGRVVPVVDRTYPPAETSEALAYVAAGHTRGKVVIDFSRAPGSPATALHRGRE